MHQNSIMTYTWLERQGIKKSRADLIRDVFEGGGQFTDRDVMARLFPGSDDLNKVRPRIQELVKSGWLEECGEARENGLPVRICRKKTDEPQTSMF